MSWKAICSCMIICCKVNTWCAVAGHWHVGWGSPRSGAATGSESEEDCEEMIPVPNAHLRAFVFFTALLDAS